MSLIGNQSLINNCGVRWLGGNAAAYFCGGVLRAGWTQPSMQRAMMLGATFPKVGSVPTGYGAEGWIMPMTAGEIASHFELDGFGVFTAAPTDGRNLAASLAGVGDITGANLALIVSAVAILQGSGVLSGDVLAELNAVAALAGTGNVTGAIQAFAAVIASITAAGSVVVTSRANGALAADLTPFTTLSPQNLAAAVWNALVADFNTAATFGEAVQSGGGGGGGPSAATIADAVWDETSATHTSAGSFGALVQTDIYTAKVVLFDDDAGGADRYVVSWFKNGAVVTSGITVPVIRVVKVVDGTDLIASQAMTQIAALSRFRYDAAGAERVASGASYLAIVSATIDGSSRVWDQPVGRDST